jgi:hypothetical protein
MKNLLALVLCFATIGGVNAQMGSVPTPSEFKKVAFFAGPWHGSVVMQGMGMPTTKANGTMNGKVILDGKYIQSMSITKMGKAGTMQGAHLISYDPFKKQFVAYWFDSSSPGVMEMTGNFQGSKLVMTSKPTEIPGMPEPATMRVTWSRPSTAKLEMLLEMKQGDKWVKLIESKYSR